ncbi:hypothetical protein IFR05_006798 [Cadophora sp. M221]|nr:hypothetical protein IFR05_006798 [Cadophora sp. M221]
MRLGGGHEGAKASSASHQTSEDTIKDLKDLGPVYSFLRQYFLYWLEAMSLLKSVSEGVVMIRKLEDLQLNESPDLRTFIQDATRFAVSNRSIIKQAPLQAYCSALVFAPEKSIVRETFKGCIPSWIQRKPRVETYWNAMLQTLEGHTSRVTSVAFSPDGKQIVSGSWDKTVRRWDAATGQQLLPALEGHTDHVTSVAFSPDGKHFPTLHVFDYWLVEGSTKLLWLPTYYRPTCEAAWGGIVALGHSLGGLSVLELQQGPKLVI